MHNNVLRQAESNSLIDDDIDENNEQRNPMNANNPSPKKPRINLRIGEDEDDDISDQQP